MLSTLLAACICATAQSAAPRQAPDSQATWERLLAGWRAERRKLRSGRVVITGKEVRFKKFNASEHHKLVHPWHEDVINIVSLFNLENERSVHQVQWGTDPQAHGSWMQTAHFYAEWDASLKAQGVLAKQNLSDPRSAFNIDFDTRVLGFWGTEELVHRRDNTGEAVDVVEIVAAQYRGETPIVPERLLKERNAPVEEFKLHFEGLEELPRRSYRATFSFNRNIEPGMYCRLSITLDEENGFTVTERSIEIVNAQSETVMMRDNATTVKWTRTAEAVWVPSESSDTRTSGLTDVKLKFKWDRVNDGSLLNNTTFDDMGAVAGTLVVDKQIDPHDAVVLGRIGEPSTADVLESDQHRTASYYPILIGIGGSVAVIFSGILMILLYQRRR